MTVGIVVEKWTGEIFELVRIGCFALNAYECVRVLMRKRSYGMKGELHERKRRRNEVTTKR